MLYIKILRILSFKTQLDDSAFCVVLLSMVDKGVILLLFKTNPPFLRFPPFLKSKISLIFMKNPRNEFIYHFYPQSVLILEECLQKWGNANLI